MIGLEFEVQAAVAPPAPLRADVACFVGHVARRDTPLPAALLEFLRGEGFAVDADDALLDVPVPLDTWELFDHLFAWERRPLLTAQQAEQQQAGDPERDPALWTESYLGAAVRAFFRHGGRRCWVVRVGDPWPFAALLDDAERVARIDRVIPGYAGRRADPRDRASWRGAGHVFGLADVSALCAPDLCDVFRGVPPEPSLALDPTPFATGFVECSEPTPALAPRGRLRFAEPRLADDPGLSAWASSVSALARIVAQRRDVQLVASVPLAIPGTLAAADLLEALVELDRSVHVDEGGVSSAFVQLVWPWLRGDTSGNLPGGVEPPEGAVLGALARSVLRSGAFHSAAGEPLRGLRGVEPELSLASRRRPVPWGDRRAAARRSLEERVTLIGDTPRGFELRSDVTTSLGESYRPAAVQRLVSMLVRAARRMGDELAFEPSGESLWAAVRRGMHSILLALWHEGALAGDSPVDAFDVRCDRSTMTQDDIDAGRAICRVSFQAAAPIERISVVLQLVGGRVSLSGEGAR